MKMIKDKVTRILPVLLAFMEVMGRMLVPGSIVYAAEDTIYPYMIYASSSGNDAVRIQAGNFGVNGNIGTCGELSFAGGNCNINGRLDEHLDSGMPDLEDRIQDTYFTGSTIQENDILVEESNIIIREAVATGGGISLSGNINLTSALMADGDITLDGNVENDNNCVIYSSEGDIVINADNLNLNGLLYAPRGEIHISAVNGNMNQVVMIARKVSIEAMSANGGQDGAMAAFIGTDYGLLEDDGASGNTASNNHVSDNTASDNHVSDNTVSGNGVSGNAASGNGVSGNGVSGNAASGNGVSGNGCQEDAPAEAWDGILRYEPAEGMKDIGIAYIKTLVSADEIGENYEGIPIVKNQLLLYGTGETTFGQMEELLEGYGFAIVGYMETISYYQVESRDALSPQGLESARLALEAEDGIRDCGYNYVMKMQQNFRTNDEEWAYSDWWGTDRCPASGDTNWNLDQIDIVKAMVYAGIIESDTVSSGDADLSGLAGVRIGVIDRGFDVWHEDLADNIFANWNNYNSQGELAAEVAVDSDKAKAASHGTHVAGIIGARFNNSKGIFGACLTPELYCFAMDERRDPFLVENQDVIMLHYALHLMIGNDVRVINYSMGYDDETVYAASQGDQSAIGTIEKDTAALEGFLRTERFNFPDADFLIVTAAGNTNDVLFYKYYQDTSDAYSDTDPSYIPVSKYNKLSSRDQKKMVILEPKETYGAKGANPDHVENEVDAKYGNRFCYSTDPVVRDHVIVVGSLDRPYKNGGDRIYKRSGFSNIGQRVDLYAPGAEIYSTVPAAANTGVTGYQSAEYTQKSGTSMASPLVAGMAGFLLSLDPGLTSGELKEILISSSVTVNNRNSVSTDDANLLIPNLANAVSENFTSINVTDAEGNPLERVEIDIYQGYNFWRFYEALDGLVDKGEFQGNEMGRCAVRLDEGDYTIRVRAPYCDEKYINFHKNDEERELSVSLSNALYSAGNLTIYVSENTAGEQHKYIFWFNRRAFVTTMEVTSDVFDGVDRKILDHSYDFGEDEVQLADEWPEWLDSFRWLAKAVLSEYEEGNIECQILFTGSGVDQEGIIYYLPADGLLEQGVSG